MTTPHPNLGKVDMVRSIHDREKGANKMLLTTMAALAAPTITDAAAGEAPTLFTTHGDCDIGGTDVCVWNAGANEVECDTGKFACISVTAWSVQYEPMQTDAYAVFGRCDLIGGSSSYFSCKVHDVYDEIELTTLRGTTMDDNLHHYYEGQSMRPTNTNDPYTSRIQGLNGEDYILGGRTNQDNFFERLWGGPDKDTMDGQAGDDFLYGEGGNDVMSGGAGNDQMHGGPGSDTMMGDEDNDWLHGGHGNSDDLDGGPGFDTLYGSLGNFDVLDGGPGDDVLCETSIPAGGCPTSQTIRGGGGSDIAAMAMHPSCGPASFTLSGAIDVETVHDGNIGWGGVRSTFGSTTLPALPSPSACTDIVLWGGW